MLVTPGKKGSGDALRVLANETNKRAELERRLARFWWLEIVGVKNRQFLYLQILCSFSIRDRE
jgi:hypothetical protein